LKSARKEIFANDEDSQKGKLRKVREGKNRRETPGGHISTYDRREEESRTQELTRKCAVDGIRSEVLIGT